MAHGYAKIEGKPMLALVHGNIGLQHASMAVYNAWCDRVPVIIVGGASWLFWMNWCGPAHYTQRAADTSGQPFVVLSVRRRHRGHEILTRRRC